MVYLQKGTTVRKVVLAVAVTGSSLELPLEDGEDKGEVELEKLIHNASDLNLEEQGSLRTILKCCLSPFAFPGD